MKHFILIASLALSTQAFAMGTAKSAEDYQNQSQTINSLDFNSHNANAAINVSNVPVSSAIAPNVYPTAPCMGSSSGGAQGLHIGLSFGTTWTDTECQIGETARGFEQAGLKEDALAIRCQGKYAKVAPSCKGK